MLFLKNGAYATANVVEGAVKTPKTAFRAFIDNTSFAEHEDAMNRYNAAEQEKRIREFRKETDELMSIQAAAEILTINKEAEDRMMEELCKEAGYHYDKKTGTIMPITQTEDSSENKLPKQVVDVDKGDLLDRINNTKVTEADAKLIDKEIEIIIKQLSSGREIDVNSEAIQNEITSLLDDRLINSGILESGQTAKDIFKSGKSGLKRIIKKKAGRTNSSIKAANKKLESVLSREEIAHVSNIVSQEIKDQKGKDKTNVSVDDVLAKLNAIKGSDGSSRVSTFEGTRGIDSSRDGTRSVSGAKDGSRHVSSDIAPQVTDEQRKAAITQFIQAVTPATATAQPKQTAADKQAIKEITQKASQRKKKLQQVMAMAMDVPLENNEVSTTAEGSAPTDKVIVQVLQGSKEITDGKRTVSLSGSDSDAAAKMLRKLLEIKEANKEAVQVLEVKKGTKGYAKAKKKKSELNVDLFELEKKLAAMGTSDELTDKEGKEITTREDTERKIKTTERKLAQAKLDEQLAGPIYDITDLIKNQMGRR